jgi:hypothetical protein
LQHLAAPRLLPPAHRHQQVGRPDLVTHRVTELT